MITCRELVELLIDFVADELPAERRARVQEHLDACPPCVAYLQTYQTTIRLSRRLPCDSMPEPLAERLMAALAELKQPGGQA
jgi:anti-sigma factor RsiW